MAPRRRPTGRPHRLSTESQLVEPDLPPSRSRRVAEAPDPIRPTASASASLQFQAALDGARIGAGTYGATFAVVRDGQVVWAGSSGVERDGRTLLTPGSPMVIGSVTKTFVAATVLELVDEGSSSLDDSGAAVPARGATGQPRDHDPPAPRPHQRPRGRLQRRDATRAWRSTRSARGPRVRCSATLHAPWYQPGEGWAYANTNYYLLGMIVERVTGSSLEQEIERRFLDPLDLGSTRSLSPMIRAVRSRRPGRRSSGHPARCPRPPATWRAGATPSTTMTCRSTCSSTATPPARCSHSTATTTASASSGSQSSRPAMPTGTPGLLSTYTTLLLHLPKRGHHDRDAREPHECRPARHAPPAARVAAGPRC